MAHSRRQFCGGEELATPLHPVRFPQLLGALRRQTWFQGVADEARLVNQMFVLATIAEKFAVKGVTAGAGNFNHPRGFGNVQGFWGKE
jgi:hypothetical protein